MNAVAARVVDTPVPAWFADAAALHAVAGVRAIDRAAVEDVGIPGPELMQRAATFAFDAARSRWPDARRVVVLCGAGNNGGDGYLFARLARRAGLDVRVFHPAGASELRGDALRARERATASGVPIAPWSGEALSGAELIVDALLGTGLSRAPGGEFADLVGAANAVACPTVSLDVPSGLDADRGTAPGACIEADLTTTFIVGKPGLHTGIARDVCGRVLLGDLAVPDAARAVAAPDARLAGPALLHRLLPPRRRTAHKGRHGRLLVVGGDEGYAGAVRLAGEAAVRSGAGLTRVATRASHQAFVTAAVPELMTRGVEDVEALRASMTGQDVLAVGPGLGTGKWGREMFEVAMTHPGPLVVDADALNLLAESPQARDRRVLTPHPGEAARLLRTGVADVESDRLAAAQAIVTRYGGVCVLKGAGTIVASGSSPPVIASGGNPGLAAGGSGDVLTGVIGALLAQGLAPLEAAVAGVVAHAEAGDRAAVDGERGMAASDVIAQLRAVLNPW